MKALVSNSSCAVMPTGLQQSWVKNKLNFGGGNKKERKGKLPIPHHVPSQKGKVWSHFFLTTDTAGSNSVSPHRGWKCAQEPGLDAGYFPPTCSILWNQLLPPPSSAPTYRPSHPHPSDAAEAKSLCSSFILYSIKKTTKKKKKQRNAALAENSRGCSCSVQLQGYNNHCRQCLLE